VTSDRRSFFAASEVVEVKGIAGLLAICPVNVWTSIDLDLSRSKPVENSLVRLGGLEEEPRVFQFWLVFRI